MSETPVLGRRLLRIQGAARYLAISPAKLRELIKERQLPIISDGPHSPWLVDIADLDAFISKKKSYYLP